jgi:hypothetical protein
MNDRTAWPDLTGPSARRTSTTLLLWSQIVGKTRLALAPMINHWWQVAFRVSAEGLTTGAIPYGSREFDVEFDFVAHELVIRTSDGAREAIPLESGTVAAFYNRYFATLRRLGIEFSIHPLAVEMPDTVWLDSDVSFRDYDPDWAHRFFLALLAANRALQEFRADFLGKASPVHFFWGGFDLAVTRFSGRPAPRHPGGVPHCPDYVMVEAYSSEVSSAGFWPGDARFPEPAFYSYAYPEPPGFREAKVLPEQARYDATLGEFLLPYAALRTASSPHREVMRFLKTTYDAAADLGGWDRAALERKAHDRDLQPSRAGRQAPVWRGAER